MPYRLALQLPQNIALAARNKPTIAGNNTSYGVGSGIAKAVRKGVCGLACVTCARFQRFSDFLRRD